MANISLDQLITDKELHLPEGSVNLIKQIVWATLVEHQAQVVWTAKVWIFTKSFTIGDLFPVFELLLGPRPTA